MLLKDLCVVSLLLIFFSLFTYGYFHIPLFLFIFLVISFYWASQHCGWESSCICGTCDRNSVSFKLRHSAIKISVFFRIWSPLFFLLFPENIIEPEIFIYTCYCFISQFCWGWLKSQVLRTWCWVTALCMSVYQLYQLKDRPFLRKWVGYCLGTWNVTQNGAPCVPPRPGCTKLQ